MIRNICYVLVVFFVLISCEKQEGTGGLNTIEGYIYMQHLNPLLEKVGAAYPAKDEAVYIIYGSEKSVGNRERTNHEGYFSFQYLLPGDYMVYAYSKDTAKFNAREDVAITQRIKLSEKKETRSLDTIFIYRHMDYDDGIATIYGRVMEINYFPGTTFPLDTIFAQNKEVFIMLVGDSGIHDRFRTAHDGSFRIENVLPGTYYIYALSEQNDSREDVPVGSTITVTETTTTMQLPTFYISNF